MRTAAVAAATLALTACSGGSTAAPPVPPASPGCPLTGPIPVECVPDDKGFDVSPVPVSTEGAPASSAAIPAVTLPAQPEDLVAGGNDRDPTLTTRTFAVTVPAGARLSVTSACRGFAELDVRTVPDSKAAHTLPCGRSDAIDITVRDPTLLAAPRRYQVTVRVPAPSRWYVAVGAVTFPAPTR